MGKGLTVRGVVFSALFAALLVAFSYVNIHLGFTPVPITLENMVIMFAGILLGPWYGFISMFLAIGLTALGLPLLHGSGGMAVILGPTGGYLWMYPISALLLGATLSRKKNSGQTFIWIFLASEVFGSLLLYVTGVPWLAHVAKISISKALILGCYPYLIGDAVKAFVTALVVIPIRKVYSVERLVGISGSTVVRYDSK